ncbi:fumarylacetoacetate hydrolase family protein, partial [Acidocella sp.]|uniref:fumarylacetoacetate hydrolase family protein n=1 Tax=Acidocella sp. TaxID=50710 RepID=UPI003CFE606E
SNPHPLGDPSNAPLTAINTMIYIGNIEILTAKSAIYLGNVGLDEQLTAADLFRAIDYGVPAVEIVGSRVANWDIKITDTIADNASSGLYVLGSRPVRLGDFDPRLCGMVMEKAGEPVSVGAGAACLGSPLNAALWLAKVMAKAGKPLVAGDTILSGALGPMAVVAPGDVFDVRIEGVGAVRAAFAKE